MEIYTKVELEKMTCKKLQAIIRRRDITGRSKWTTKKKKVWGILLDQTKKAQAEEDSKVKSLHPGIHKAFVIEIQRFLKENSDIDDEGLADMVEKHVPRYSRGLIMKAIRQARKFLDVQAEICKLFTERNFGQNLDDLMETLAHESKCSFNFVKAALEASKVVKRVAARLAEKYVVRQDIDKKTYFLTKEIADRFLGGYIGKIQFWAVHAAVGKRQEDLHRLLAESKAKEKAAAEAREQERAKQAAETKAREEAKELAKQEYLAEIKNRPAVCLRFRGRTGIIPVLPVNDLTEAQMLAADFGKPIFVQLAGEIKRVSNSKSGRLQMESAYNFDVLTPAEARRVRSYGKETLVKPRANVLTIAAPRVYPTWVAGEKGVVKAACIVNPTINMSTLAYINAASRFLREYSWVALENGKNFFLFKKVADGTFVACGTGRKPTPEEKKEAKAAVKAKAKAKATEVGK